MKKLFYVVLALGLFSCSTNDDVVENTKADLEPDKGYIFEMDRRSAMPSPEKYYRFTYENGHLKSMLGRSYSLLNVGEHFYPDVLTKLTYPHNKVQIDFFEMEDSSVYITASYSMENNMPVKAEFYENYKGYPPYLVTSKTYSYEKHKIKIYPRRDLYRARRAYNGTES